MEEGALAKIFVFHIDVLTVSISTLLASTTVLGDDRYNGSSLWDLQAVRQ